MVLFHHAFEPRNSASFCWGQHRVFGKWQLGELTNAHSTGYNSKPPGSKCNGSGCTNWSCRTLHHAHGSLPLHPLRNIPPSPTQWDIPQIQPTMAHFITPWRHPNYKCESVCVWYMDVLLTACCCFKKVLVLVCSCLYLLFESWRKGKDSLSLLYACCCFKKILVLVCVCAWAGLFLFVLAISILVKKGLDSGSCDHMLSYDKK